jgi:UDP-N-acetylmuramyl pentapeptide phosphotransferase/UDP-N-acetylglucosamine-1-phosphate transferase
MIIKNYLLIISQFILSYFFFKIFLKTNLFKLSKIGDTDTRFGRAHIHNSGGIIFVLVFLIYLFLYNKYYFLNLSLANNYFIFLIAIIFLATISFLDDKFNIDPTFRLLVQIICVYFSLSTVPHIIEFLPIKISIFIALIFWIYIINITNFVDGADGFCAVICLGFFLSVLCVTTLFDINLFSKFISLLILPVLLVFLLFFNKPPAKIFMGDTGAISLGFLVGFSILELSFNGYFFLAISSFTYPIVDCSITIIKKTLNGNYPWKRMSDYYFLKVKKDAVLKNYILKEKKIFILIVICTIVNLLIIILSIKLNNQYIAIINFINSFILTRIYTSISKN